MNLGESEASSKCSIADSVVFKITVNRVRYCTSIVCIIFSLRDWYCTGMGACDWSSNCLLSARFRPSERNE